MLGIRVAASALVMSAVAWMPGMAIAISGEKVTLGKAWVLTVTGDRAYGSFPATLAYKQKGNAENTSDVLTIALQKTSGRWLMTGWSWSARSQYSSPNS